MQIFLPYSDFDLTSKCLDKKRLFKQLVECRQILATMGEEIYKNDGSRMKPTHVNHPIYKLWNGFSESLKQYHNAILKECKNRKIKTRIKPIKLKNKNKIDLPHFIGNKEYHDAHRSNLIRKFPEHYSQFKWSVPTNLPYIWE